MEIMHAWPMHGHKRNIFHSAIFGLLLPFLLASCGGTDGGDASGNSVGGSNACPSCATNVLLQLSWDPNPDVVLGYIIYYGPDEAAATQEASTIPLSSGVIDPGAPSVIFNAGQDLLLNTGEPVCFRLKAYNSAGSSTFSGAACTSV